MALPRPQETKTPWSGKERNNAEVQQLAKLLHKFMHSSNTRTLHSTSGSKERENRSMDKTMLDEVKEV